MSTIVTRSGKGSPLTHVEVDANFTNLNTDKYQSGDAVSFTTLTATGQTSLGGVAGSEGLRVLNVASTVNYIQARGHITANAPSIRSAGSDTNIGLGLSSQGTGAISFYSSSISSEQMRVSHTASAVNYVQVTGAATGSAPVISTQGSDTNRGLEIQAKGTGTINIGSQRANYLRVEPASAGNTPILSAQGSDTNIDLTLTPKGTGNVRFGTYTASMALTVQGYIEIKDSGGTVRKLAVIA